MFLMAQKRDEHGLDIRPHVLGPGANAPMIQTAEPQPVVMYDTENPRSLINLLRPTIREKVQEALFEEAALFEMDEGQLYKKLRERQLSITATDNRLRLKFWMEYDHCQSVCSNEIDMMRVIAGICTYEYFHRRYMKTPSKVAWLLCPPTGYVVKANEALEFGLEQLRDILDQPHVLPGGKVDTKLGELKLKIIQMLDVRVKGAPVQRIVQANLNTNAIASSVTQTITPMAIESLEKELRSLEKREKELQNGQTVLIPAQTQQKK